ncbi:Undecaprenyl-diphosphatase [Sulfurimonas denitrificans DSM 1251]|uniref:Undecaprenyl-diphosphatase n=1 Tax=Sulfurimonas denitrificans (strain ATCC 33889 / DSM 1251) TaxID=326298 RepID=UPPP_SULDN|nr:undecaprenyl-diphosphate phosphatase [Sulfurimonas denitrificans]Q30UH8.1 RecName: Full=Undecaprenyl-diphosphatase; AltName: Full=Bacitracin resistance protein; AltName: Full=Undecaprenyl pyrophosphate phosphatase [Sulfurimonas denitrificans DSM 1251]ABB43353.1 Undecaprenyl-diphosphatase [Sulfurimonas denitrificans DSM 1251]MDD3442295.1 undecaprenyl-diphosphate phosphatase [Sulfurimonas denitrificans]
MTILDSIILGAIEGFTEFLPISSTGHLIVASEFLGLEQNAINKAYEVIIQFSAILAVIFNYKDKFSIKKIDLWMKVFIAFLPLAIIGFIFSTQIKELFSLHVVAVMFIVGGVVFLIVEKFFINEDEKTIYEVEAISLKQSLIIGFAQIFALIPGTSRAGSTIIGALLVGLSRKASAEFSFLLAFPVMGAVTAYDLLKHYKDFSEANLIILGVGFVTSFVVAYLSIKLFLKFLEKFTFFFFGVYRIVFGVILLLFFN